MAALSTSNPETPQTFGDLLRGFPTFLRTSLPSVIASAVTAGVVGYVLNIWIMAVKYQGTNDIPKGTPVTTGDNLLGGAMFWALLSAVVFGIGSYAKGVGLKRFLADLRTLPRVLVGLVRRDGAAGRVHLLWGACAALLAGLVLPPATGAVLAVAFLAAAPTVLGSIVSSFFGRLFSGLLKPLAPDRERPVGIEAMMVALIGSSLALSANFVITDRAIRVLLAVACGALALVMSQRLRPPTAVTTVLVLVGVVGAYVLITAARAKADDGSFAECGNDIARWLRECGGADKIRKDGVVGAVTAALGAPPGAFVGKVVAEVEKALGGGQAVFPRPDPQDGPSRAPGAQQRPPDQQQSQPPQPPAQMPTAQEINDRLGRLGGYNPNNTPWDQQKAIDDFFAHLRDNQGQFTPDDLRRLQQLEGTSNTIYQANHDAITATLDKQGEDALKQREIDLKAEADREKDARTALDKLERQAEFARNHQDDLPGRQYDTAGNVLTEVDDILGRMRRGEPVSDDERKRVTNLIRDVNTATRNTVAGASESDAAAAELDAIRAQELDTLKHRMQIAAGVAAAVTGIGLAAAGAAGIATSMTAFGSTFTTAQLGGTLWGLGGLQGAVTGFREGETLGGHDVGDGMMGAVVGGARNMLPINLVSKITEDLSSKGNDAPIRASDLIPNSWDDVKGRLWGAGGIALATIQDVGNLAGARDAGHAGGLGGVQPTVPNVSDERIAQAVKEREAGGLKGASDPKPYTGTDYPVPGAKDGAAKGTWDNLGSDGRGRVFGPDGKQVAEVLPDGRVRPTIAETGADGKLRLANGEPIPADRVTIGPDGKVSGYELADGRRVDLNGPDGKPVIVTKGADGVETVANAQGTRGRPGSLDPDVAKKWDSVHAGPDGEIYGADGRVIGTIDANGNMVDANGRRITDIGSTSGGRVNEFTVDQPRGSGASEPVTMKTREPDTGPKPTRTIEYTDASGNVQQGTVPLADDTAVRGLRPGEEIPRNNLHEIGATGEQIDGMGRVAREGYVDANGVSHPVELEARSTNPESMRHILDGTGTPKPLDVKTKTINPIDTMLGASPDDVGKVGFFEPQKPANLGELPPDLQTQINNRYDQRMAEIADHGPHIQELEQQGFLKRTPEGTLVAGDNYPNPAERGKAFAGDIDLVSINDAKTGQPLSPEAYEQVKANAMASDMQAQHGAEQYSRQDLKAMGWPDDKINKLFNSLSDSHARGAEITYRVGPDGIPVRGSRLSSL